MSLPVCITYDCPCYNAGTTFGGLEEALKGFCQWAVTKIV